MFRWLGNDVEAAPEVAAGVGQTGLAGSVRVAGPSGWRAVRAVAPGDLVLTFDAGMQRVEEILSEPAWPGRGPCPHALWPVEVPAGALGNREVMHVAPDQPILIESDVAEALTGDPFALVPARALVDAHGIHRAPPAEGAEVVTLTFAAEQIVFAGGGAMLHCPATACDLLEAGGRAPRYPLLGGHDAARAVQQLDREAAQARSAGLPGIKS
ncbi:Hint domain-containing protein [Roseovarius sp. D0-M9]|uniref:Hint domain-containing protein n=1 Tax=Roseovarius sp. D0-M9 TaxID=3127117 RepID=UPI00300F9E47